MSRGSIDDTQRAMMALYLALTSKKGARVNMTEICIAQGVGTDTPSIMFKMGYLTGDPSTRSRQWNPERGIPTTDDAAKVREFRYQESRARAKVSREARETSAAARAPKPQETFAFSFEAEIALENRIKALEEQVVRQGVAYSLELAALQVKLKDLENRVRFGVPENTG